MPSPPGLVIVNFASVIVPVVKLSVSAEVSWKAPRSLARPGPLSVTANAPGPFVGDAVS